MGTQNVLTHMFKHLYDYGVTCIVSVALVCMYVYNGIQCDVDQHSSACNGEADNFHFMSMKLGVQRVNYVS